jgi:hypothetical protein
MSPDNAEMPSSNGKPSNDAKLSQDDVKKLIMPELELRFSTLTDKVNKLQERLGKVNELEEGLGKVNELQERLEQRFEEKLTPITAVEAEILLGTLIRSLNPYTKIMHYPPGNLDPARVAELERKQEGEDADEAVKAKLAQYQIEVDNRYGSENGGGDYLYWEFKKETQIVKKAVRVAFRHPSKKGGWITDHLLIGFAGSNGP